MPSDGRLMRLTNWLRWDAGDGSPLPQRPDLVDGPFTFRTRILEDGREFHTWTCQLCVTEIGSCKLDGPWQRPIKLKAAAQRHIDNCHQTFCGQDGCISCPPPTVVVT